MARIAPSAARHILWPLALGMALGLIAGCKQWNWRGRGFEDEEAASMSRELRPPADAKKFSGLDARSQEIERNLGVR